MDSSECPKLGNDIPLECELMSFHTPQVSLLPELLDVEGYPCIQSRTGTCSFKIRIKNVSLVFDNKPFKLRVSAKASLIGFIEPAISSPMIVIRHLLRVHEQPPHTWYKDQGGSIKCMMVDVALVDADGRVVQNREVPLRVLLRYENDLEVKNQGLLKVNNDQLVEIGKSGKCSMKVRIEDVSKNHQKQNFILRIMPNVEPSEGGSPLHGDIAGCLTNPVMVRSKVNPRPKAARQGVPGGAGSDDDTEQFRPPRPVPPVKRQPESGWPTHSQVVPVLPAPGPALAQEQLHSDRPPTSVTDILDWCDFVAVELKLMEWQHIGCEISELDGLPNPSRVLYRCPACWQYKDPARPGVHKPDCMILRALQQYEQQSAMRSRARGESRPLGQAALPRVEDLGLGDWHQPQLPPILEEDGMDMPVEDSHVWAVFMESKPSKFGYFAFDQADSVIGVYVVSNCNLPFFALRQYEGKADTCARETRDRYLECKRMGGALGQDCILSRADCVTLKMLREQALLWHFRVESSGFIN